MTLPALIGMCSCHLPYFCSTALDKGHTRLRLQLGDKTDRLYKYDVQYMWAIEGSSCRSLTCCLMAYREMPLATVCEPFIEWLDV